MAMFTTLLIKLQMDEISPPNRIIQQVQFAGVTENRLCNEGRSLNQKRLTFFRSNDGCFICMDHFVIGPTLSRNNISVNKTELRRRLQSPCNQG